MRPVTSVDAQVVTANDRVLTASQVAEAPVVDGVLDDNAWAQNPAVEGFIQRVPDDGEGVTERTALSIVFDDAAIYVAAWLFDRDPAGIVPGEGIRDHNLDESDAFLLVLDTFRDRQNGFVFGTNPAGIEYDGQIANEGEGGVMMRGSQRQQRGSGGGFNLNWDGSWTVATSRDREGWYAEFRIPFATLRYGQEVEQIWGLNAVRRIRRRNEEAMWAPVPRQFNLFRISYAGDLSGLEVPFQRSITITPYLLGSAERDYAGGEDVFTFPGELGADVKVQVNQGLTLDYTLNTDFAQVEVDDAQVNLTRFSLFFPEKRPFFLENAGYFSVGTEGAELFFSRGIGIADGRPVPIKQGARLSGRAAGLNVGLLHIRTDGLAGIQPANGYTVARLAKELPNRTRLGVLFVDRSALEVNDDYNRIWAFDGQVGVGEALTLSGIAGGTRTPGLDGADHLLHTRAAWLDREWDIEATYREVGANFSPDVGFLPRSDYRLYDALVLKFVRFGDRFPWLRELRPHIHYSTYRVPDSGIEESERIHLHTHVEFSSGALVGPIANRMTERLVVPFEISEGVILQPGVYEWWEEQIAFNSDLSAPWSVSGSLTAGDFWTGTRTGLSATVTMRSGSALSTSLRMDYNNVELNEGSFSTTLLGWRLAYFFTPSIYLQSLLQHSNQIDTWSTNVRFGWLDTANTGLFLVYNETQGFDTLAGPQYRSLIFKYTRLFDLPMP
jgi:hypothetical protein